MKQWAGMRRGMGAVLLCAVAAYAGNPAGDKKEKPKSSLQTVDSGSFGVFVKGQRVVTEVFHIQQENGNSSIKSQLKEVAGSVPIDQKSDLEITANGELIRYEWSQGAPTTGSLIVLPNNEFLLEKITASPTGKAAEQPFLMPNTSMILDNNFFVHREVLAWKYLKGICQPSPDGGFKCRQEQAEFGTLVPQDRSSIRVRLELVGKEKVTIRGAERELMRLNLVGEGVDWALWVDDKDQFKLMRIAIPADNTEVVRD